MSTTKLDLKVEDLKLSKDLKNLPVIAKYDEAFKELISQVFAGKVILAPTDRAFELYINQTQGEKIKFPFISLFPSGPYNSVNNNFASSHIGHPAYRSAIIYDDNTLEKKGQNKLMQNFYQVMYFDIPYSIECWSNNRIQALQLVQELIFWLNSQGEVKIQYKNNEYTANMTINNTITDNTGYTNYANIGNIYRFTLNINIEAPVFRTQNYLNINTSDITLVLKDDENTEEK